MKTQFQIPILLNTPKFIEAWECWLADRRERRKPVTSRGAELQLKKLESIGAERAIAAIEFSIMAGYQGIFESNSQTTRAVQEKKPTKWEIIKRVDAIDSQMKILRTSGGNEVAGGYEWHDKNKMSEHRRLRLLRAELNKQLIEP